METFWDMIPPVDVYADGLATGRFALTDGLGRFDVAGFRGDVISLRVRALGHAAALRRVRFAPGKEMADVGVRLVRGSAVTVSARKLTGRDRENTEAVLLPEWYELAADEPRLRPAMSAMSTTDSEKASTA